MSKKYAKNKESSGTGSSIEKYSTKYWNSEITNAESRLKDFWEHANRSIKVYNTQHKYDTVERRLNVWWYVVNTMLPAYYSSTPKSQVELRKRSGNEIFQFTCTILERNVQYAIDEYFDFDYTALSSALQFLLTGRAVLCPRYEAKIDEVQSEIALIRTPDGQIIDGQGQPFEGDLSEFQQSESGLMTMTQTTKEIVDQCCYLDLLHVHDYLESDGRSEAEITWRSRRAFMNEEKVKDKWGSKFAKELNYNSFPEAIEKNERTNRDLYNGKAELFEIWCEESGKVYWFHRKGEKSIIESGDPPIKYEGFYPFVKIDSSIDPNSTIPTSDYTHCEDQILFIERLTTRMQALTQAVRTNFAYDSTMKELEDLLIGDLRGIPVTSWPAYKSRGGLGASIEMLNTDPYIKSLQVLAETRAAALQQLYETLKASDLLRGVSEPTKTATANRLENQWSSLGLIVRQNQFANFIGEALDKLGTVIASQFSADRIFRIADADQMLSQFVQDPMQLQATKQQIEQILRDDKERCYRIKIASDSMVALDQRQERQDGADLMASAGGFFDQMKGLIEQYPPMAPFCIQLFQNVVRRYRGGKEIEPIFTQAMGTVSQMAQQKMAQAAQQPPTPGVIEAQARVQIAQIESQDSHQKNMIEMQNMQLKAQTEAAKLQFDAQAQLKEFELKAQELQLKLMEIRTNAATAINEGEVTKRAQDIDAMMKQMELEIEAVKAKFQAFESVAEERRLAKEANNKNNENPLKTTLPRTPSL